MAIITKGLANGTDADGAMWSVSYDYDNVTLELLSIRCDNSQASIARDVMAASTSNPDDSFTFNFAAGQDVVRNVPPGQVGKLNLVVTPSGKLDGVEWHIS
jgi:hypothetical protein